jgi:beta-mannosidase
VKQTLWPDGTRCTLHLGPRADAAPAALRGLLHRGIPSTLLGCVHQDLVEAGLIPDPAKSTNELDVQWVGECDWVYRFEFNWPPVESADAFITHLTEPDSNAGSDADANSDPESQPRSLESHPPAPSSHADPEASRMPVAAHVPEAPDPLSGPPAPVNIDLVLDSLDTFATISLNGAELARTESMYIPHRLPIGAHLRTGLNTLELAFEAPLRAIRERAARFGPRPVNGDWEPFNFARRPACNFGWDWGPKLATCGVWEPVSIERWSVARFGHVRPLVSHADESAAILEVHVDLVRSTQQPLTVSATLLDPQGQTVASATVSIGDTRSTPPSLDAGPERVREQRSGSSPDTPPRQPAADVTSDSLLIPLHVTNPQLWWPRSHGPQPLYTLSLWLYDTPVETALDHTSRTIDLRTISLDTPPDRFGESFELRVNNRRVFMQGANWIPDGPWPMNRGSHTLRDRVQQAADANMNTLRVWGGGCYEPDSFYDACDELGILVCQDFMFACAMYPEEEPYRSLVEREARHHVARLSSHPSLALWCGGNECVWGYENWGWKQRLAPNQSWGAGYYFDLLPRVVRELDPTRPYWANSPWSRDMTNPTSPTNTPNSPDRGDRHTWDVQGARYRDIIPRACTEFGHQSISLLATLRDALPLDDFIPELPFAPSSDAGPEAPRRSGLIESQQPAVTSMSRRSIAEQLAHPQLAHRQRATGGHEPHHLAEIRRVYGEPRDFLHFHDLALRAQARALSIGVEWLRANQPRCSAALIWQLNDAWAGFSWSLVDAAGRRKPAWHAVRRSMSPRLLTIQPIEQRPTLIAINNTMSEWSGRARVRRIDFDGATLRESHVAFAVPAGEVRRIAAIDDLVAPTSRPWREITVVDPIDATDLPRATWLYRLDRELQDPPPKFTWSWREAGKHNGVLTLTAASLLRDIIIHADRVDGRTECDAHVVTLLPGESFDFPISRPYGDPSRLVAPDCLTTARAARASGGEL